jgi:hypothetical protein
VLAFWRDLGRAFVAALCALPDLEERRERADPAPRPGELERLAAAAPPMPGGEYLSAEVLRECPPVVTTRRCASLTASATAVVSSTLRNPNARR